ncbi:MAG: DUF5995 family protein [Saprospiraceae bacterium]
MNSIDDIIAALEDIIEDSENNNNTLGYFAVLYQKVTKKVKEGIENGLFEDSARMEQLDVVFAERYFNAYDAFRKNEALTASWEKAFSISSNYWPIVLQHLLIGINAHINLDLGIAAAQVSQNKDINDLENDFNKINAILSSLVGEVQNNLSSIWPTLKRILKKTGRADDFMVDFSMKIARDGAWKFAKSIATKPPEELSAIIATRDQKVAQKAIIITNPGLLAKVVLYLIRIGERGSVSDKISNLKEM